MITLGGAVLVIALWFGVRRGYLGAGSVVAGILAGLVFATTSIGAPVASAVNTSATAFGQGVKSTASAIVDSHGSGTSGRGSGK